MSKSSMISAFLTCMSSHQALASSRCRDKLVKDREVQEAGTIYDQNNKISMLEDGFYVYVISNQESVILGERLHNGNDSDEILVTHRSLVNRLNKSHKGWNVVTAGEIRILNNRVTKISNQSGTYRHQNGDHLAYSEKVLLKNGLNIEAGTIRFDAAVFFNGINDPDTMPGMHLKDTEEVLARIKYKGHVHKELTEGAADIYKKLYDLYPSDSPPGTIDWKSLINARADLSKDYELALFVSLVQNDGIAGALQLWQGLGEDHSKLINTINRLRRSVVERQ